VRYQNRQHLDYYQRFARFEAPMGVIKLLGAFGSEGLSIATAVCKEAS